MAGTALSSARDFATTCWTLVVAAGHEPSAASRVALAQLCRTYWYPLYAYVRRRGHDAPDAQDLTQAFFARLLEKRIVRLADRDRGRFRSFLLSSLNHFLSNEWRNLRTQKRGGGNAPLPLDFSSAEERLRREPVDEMTPVRVFERRWARVVLKNTLLRLREQYETRGRADLFDRLVPLLEGERQAYRDIAVAAGTTEGAVKVAVHRLRKEFGQCLRDQIADTVGDSSQVEQEMEELLAAVRD